MNYNIKPKNKNMTKSIQEVINKCSESGGGQIYFEDGVFIIGTIYLKSNILYRLSHNTIIKGSENVADYTADTHKQMYRNETHMDKCLIFAHNCENITIEGGKFDGNGALFDDNRPMMFRYLNCKNIRITNVQMVNPASWTNAFIGCKNIWINNIDIHSRANENGDGLDFDACSNVFVSNSKFNCSDDCICVQNSSKDIKASDIFISNNTFESKWAGIRIGLLSTYDIENIFISNCTFKNIDCSGLKIQSAEGAQIKNIVCSNLAMNTVRRPLFMTANRCRENVDYINEKIKTISRISNVTIKNVFATSFDNNDLPSCMIIDSARDGAIENIILEDINYTVFGDGNFIDRSIPHNDGIRAEAYEYKGELPASGLYARNVHHLSYRNININTKNPDRRKDIVVI